MVSCGHMTREYLPKLAWAESEIRTEAVRRAHKQSESITRPALVVSYVRTGFESITHQVRSVKVAKCKLLTTMMGVICWVSYTSTASCVATA